MATRFEVRTVDEPRERRKRRRKIVAATALGVVVLAAASGAAWYFSPPPLPETIEEARAVVDSPRFQRLSTDDKRVYYDVIREQYGSLNRDERRALRQEDEQLSQAMREAWMIRMREMMVTYADTPPEEREQLMETMRPERPRGDRPQRPDEGERPERTPEEQAERAERMRDRISDRMANGDAQMNQLMREFFAERRRMRDQSR